MFRLISRKDALDRLCGSIIRARGYCQRCGATEDLTWAHIISRKCIKLRWSVRNALCLCWPCHSYFTVNPVGKQNWKYFVISIIGELEYQELVRESSYAWSKFEMFDYDKIRSDLSQFKMVSSL